MNESVVPAAEPRSIAATALSAAAIGTLQIGVAVSLAALIFSGPLSDGAGRAAAGFILATAIMSIAVGLKSRVTPVIAGVQDTAAIVAAAVAASIAADTAATERVSTVLVMLAIAGLATAMTMLAVGRYGFGAIVRFLPYPVISGFMAGTGWLLFRGGIEVMIDRPVELRALNNLVPWQTSKYLIAGLVLGLFMLVCVLRRITSVAISAAILFSAVAFHLVGQLGWGLDALEDNQWLIGPFPSGGGWKPIGLDDFAATDWGAIGSHWGGIGAVVAVSIVGVMLNLSGLEEVIDGEIDVDHEMQVAGIANAPIAVGGGLISYHLIGDTTLASKLGVRSSATPLTIAAIALALFAFGYELIALMPRTVAGGVLVGIGLTVMADWLKGALSGMGRADAGFSALILFIIAGAGILTGVGVGLALATLFFVVRYSRVDPVRHVVDAAGRSNVDRPIAERRALRSARNEIVAVELQGYLFFGSVSRLRATITAHHDDAIAAVEGTQPMRFLVLDFARVTGVDLTAASGIRAMIKPMRDRGIDVILSGLIEERHGQILATDLNPSHVHLDYDHAVAWAEDHLLASTRPTASGADDSPPTAIEVPELFRSMPPREIAAGDVIIDLGGNSRDLFVLESGQLSAWTLLEDGRRARLRQISAGAVMGEIAFCTGAARTAEVIADTPAVIRVLTRDHFEELLEADPAKALEIQEFLLRRLSFRLADTSSLVRDLMR